VGVEGNCIGHVIGLELVFAAGAVNAIFCEYAVLVVLFGPRKMSTKPGVPAGILQFTTTVGFLFADG